MLKKAMNRKAKDFLMLNLGTMLVAAGVYFFKFPNNFSTGGVSGLAIVLGHYIPGLSSGALVFLINMALLGVGFAVFGKGFGLRTAYSSTLFSLVIWVLELLCPMSAPFTTQPLLELVFAVGLPAVGSALLFNMDASTGGTDVVAMLLKKYTSINIGRALLCVDLVITVAACFAFGMETGLFSILGLVLKSLVVDMVIENINTCKYFNIITSDPERICTFITGELHRSATVLEGEGAYTHQHRFVVLTAMKRAQAVHLRRFIRENDPQAFILISDTSEIIGKGFRGVA